jgi:hypothetical protein
MIVQNIILSGQIAGAIGAIIGTFILILRYMVQKPLDKRIIEVTREIQPNANGGKSLADVAAGVLRVERKLENIGKRVTHLEKITN